IGRSLLPQQVARRDAHGRDQLAKFFAGRWRLEIFAHLRLSARLAENGNRVAGGAAGWVMVDRDRHSAAFVFMMVFGAASSQLIRTAASTAPASSAAMKPGRSAGRMPANVSLNARAIATAGLAKEVEAVNQYA